MLFCVHHQPCNHPFPHGVLPPQGNAPPGSWGVMERFVGQAGHFLPWGEPVYDDLPLPEERWAPAAPAAAPDEAPLSPTTAESSRAASSASGGRCVRMGMPHPWNTSLLQPPICLCSSAHSMPGCAWVVACREGHS